MKTLNLLIWVLVIVAIGGFGIGSMVRAYLRADPKSVLFSEPIALSATKSFAAGVPPTLQSAAAKAFQQGCDRFVAGRYRGAIDCFGRAVQHDPDLAEAFHNRGLAFANLGQDGEAVANLVAAGDRYLQQNNPAAADQIKVQLQTLKARKLAEESK